MKANPHECYGQEEFLTLLVQRTENMCVYLTGRRQGICSEGTARLHGMPTVIENFPDYPVEHGKVDPKSIEAWRSLFRAIERGEKNGSVRITLKTQTGGPIRYWIHFNTITDTAGSPALALLFFGDITEEYRNKQLQNNDISALLQATRHTFPEILTLNLTRNTYRMLQYDGATTLGTPWKGKIDDMLNIRLGGVVDEDRELFVSTFSVDSLRRTFLEEGRDTLQLVYRRPKQDGSVYWIETTAVRQDNSLNSDVLIVAMSRHIDAQKAEEARLREQLHLQTEELRLTMSHMGKVINYYDIPTCTMTLPPSVAARVGYPAEISDFPESFLASPPPGFPPETLNAIRSVYDAIRRGEPNGSAEFTVTLPSGDVIWELLEFAVIFDSEKRPARAVVAVENVTERHVQVQETKKLKENERLLRLIAQHSDRTICYYDLQADTAHSWDADICAKCLVPRLCRQTSRSLLECGDILPESRDDVAAMFRDIHAGQAAGTLKMRARDPAGVKRWFDLQYSTIFDAAGKPEAALISHKDVTEQYEHELAYRRMDQKVTDDKNLLGMLEVDLDTDRIEKLGGQSISADSQFTGQSFSTFSRQMVYMKCLEQDRDVARRFFSSSHLLSQYKQGIQRLEHTWQVRFRDGQTGWLLSKIDLISDPYTGHIKAFFRLSDVTHEMQKQLDVQRRSERDGMTGLFNRATAEAKIRSQIAKHTSPGILILLDLDDLKGINDIFGHSEGDRAILGIAETLKSHFRDADILGRSGGDEFIVYLPGAAGNRDSIAMSLAVLLRKLADIPIGSNDEHRIHCSIGCTVMSADTDSFDDLYKQADTALYHVKRNGKNNFAFYSPEMEQDDYQFQKQKLLSSDHTQKFGLDNMNHLLNVISSFYPLVVSVNISTNAYYLMQEMENGLFAQTPTLGVLDEFLCLTEQKVHPDDVSAFREKLLRQNLLQAYARGESYVRSYFRILLWGKYVWVETTAIFYQNDSGDVCSFILVRWADERSGELDQL